MKSKKQPLVTMHTQEAECVQMAMGICNARIMINFMDELGFKKTMPIPLFEDNEAACKLATEHPNTSRVAVGRHVHEVSTSQNI